MSDITTLDMTASHQYNNTDKNHWNSFSKILNTSLPCQSYNFFFNDCFYPFLFAGKDLVPESPNETEEAHARDPIRKGQFRR